jgi:hypothetical protein
VSKRISSPVRVSKVFSAWHTSDSSETYVPLQANGPLLPRDNSPTKSDYWAPDSDNGAFPISAWTELICCILSPDLATNSVTSAQVQYSIRATVHVPVALLVARTLKEQLFD